MTIVQVYSEYKMTHPDIRNNRGSNPHRLLDTYTHQFFYDNNKRFKTRSKSLRFPCKSDTIKANPSFNSRIRLIIN